MRFSPLPALWIALLGACVDGASRPGSAVDPATVQKDADTVAVLEIRFLDVGQGDAVLLRSGGRVALVDAGPADAIVPRLRALGVDTLDLLVASHNHADHIGGADAVLDSLPVRFYLDNGHPASTRIQQRVLQRVEEKGITYLQATPRTLTLGGARLRVIPPPQGVGGDEQNNRSLTLVVERGPFEALLTGDSEVELLNALLAGESLPDAEVLKAAHHGSRNGVTPAWLSRTAPEVVVVSVGESNNYGHPNLQALRYYCLQGRRVYRTDLHGEVAVRVEADGGYSVQAQRRNGANACPTDPAAERASTPDRQHRPRRPAGRG